MGLELRDAIFEVSDIFDRSLDKGVSVLEVQTKCANNEVDTGIDPFTGYFISGTKNH